MLMGGLGLVGRVVAFINLMLLVSNKDMTSASKLRKSFARGRGYRVEWGFVSSFKSIEWLKGMTVARYKPFVQTYQRCYQRDWNSF